MDTSHGTLEFARVRCPCGIAAYVDAPLWRAESGIDKALRRLGWTLRGEPPAWHCPACNAILDGP